MSFEKKILECKAFYPDLYIPFYDEGHLVGHVLKSHVKDLTPYSHILKITDKKVKFHKEVSNSKKKTSAMLDLAQGLRKDKKIKSLRKENYAIKLKWEDETLFEVDRAIAEYFGLTAYGIHVNGYIKDPKTQEIKMWIARRALDRGQYPGRLDQIVAGGQPADLSLEVNLEKESYEEAKIGPKLLEKAQAVSCLHYLMSTTKGARNDTIYVYDLELPVDFMPENHDGEVDSFELLPIEEVLKIVHDTHKFKFNCNLVLIDFALRHKLLPNAHQSEKLSCMLYSSI